MLPAEQGSALQKCKGPSLPSDGALNYADAILATIRQPLLVLDSALRVKTASQAFCNLFQVSMEHVVGRFLYDLGDRQWDIPALRTLLEEILPHRQVVTDYEVAHNFEHLGPRLMLLNARKLNNGTNDDDLILLAIEDVTERQQRNKSPQRSEWRLNSLIAALPNAILKTDADGKLLFWNPATEKFWGSVPQIGPTPWRLPLPLSHPDGNELIPDESPIRLSLKEQPAISGQEIVIERPDGRKQSFLAYPPPIHEADGILWGAVHMLVDITSHKRAEEVAQRLAAIVQSSDDAIISKNLDGIITSWNHGAEQLFGYTAAEAVGQSIQIVIPPSHKSEEEDILQRLRHGEHIQHYETQRLRRSGSTIWVSLTISPIYDSAGNVVGASSITRDMSERREADLHLKTLMDELNHRVKNTMAVVQAIAAQTLSSAKTLEEAGNSFNARLLNLAKAHDVLTQGNWVSADLRDLVADTIKPHEGKTGRFRIDGPGALLAPSVALGISMALHELCTNATKYGSLSTPEGQVSICWQIDMSGIEAGQSGRLVLHWTESGGPTVVTAKPQHRGFGSRLIERAVATELDGQVCVQYLPAGVKCTIVVPLPAGIENARSQHVQHGKTTHRHRRG